MPEQAAGGGREPKGVDDERRIRSGAVAPATRSPGGRRVARVVVGRDPKHPRGTPPSRARSRGDQQRVRDTRGATRGGAPSRVRFHRRRWVRQRHRRRAKKTRRRRQRTDPRGAPRVRLRVALLLGGGRGRGAFGLGRSFRRRVRSPRRKQKRRLRRPHGYDFRRLSSTGRRRRRRASRPTRRRAGGGGVRQLLVHRVRRRGGRAGSAVELDLDDEGAFRVAAALSCPTRGQTYSLNDARFGDWPETTLRVGRARGEGTDGETVPARYVCSLVTDFHRTLHQGGWCKPEAAFG